MGSILCCVDDKRNYQHSDHLDDYGDLAQDTYTSGIRAMIRQPMDHKDIENSSQATGEAVDSVQSEKAAIDQNAIENMVNDHLEEYAFDFDIDDDQEIEELNMYRNQYEQEIKFSKNGLIQTIQSQIDFEESDLELKKWELKLNKEDIKVYIKKGGSHITADHTYIKTEVIFNSYYQMNKIIAAVFKVDHRLHWDKNILKQELIPIKGQSVYLNYQLNKAPLNFQNRDFLDKYIKFTKDGKFYVYHSLIPNDSEIKPEVEKIGRALTFIGMQKMERRQEDGKIKYTMFMQCDLKMNITPKLIGMFLPQGMQDWLRKINKYMADHYDKIQ